MRNTEESLVPSEIFKAYDIRGIYPSQLNEDGAYRIAQAYAKFLGPRSVVVGRDVRLSGQALFNAVVEGLTDHGAHVIDIGVVTTEMLYFATAALHVEGGIAVTASHSPREWNGMKLMRRNAVPISGDTGIQDIQRIVASGYRAQAPRKGDVSRADVALPYFEKCLSFIDQKKIKPLTVAANGMSGPVLSFAKRLPLPIRWVTVNEIPDGSFPKGPPDPLRPENRLETIDLVRTAHADLGVAWDADADRFFLFDETGEFVSGYFLTAFLGAHFAKKNPGARIIHDPRLVWAIEDSVRAAHGTPIVSKAGHSFIKERMRSDDAIFAGEMSGHYYFRDFWYADSGLIPFLLMLEIVSEADVPVSELFHPLRARYFASEEMNFAIADKAGAVRKIEERYADGAIERIDGLSVSYPDWRFNVRLSNTENVVRLNMEAKHRNILSEQLEILTKLLA
jgi:phosphomannomutase